MADLNVKIERGKEESAKALQDSLTNIGLLCDYYDKGIISVVVLMATLLRTLFKTKGSSVSLLEQNGLGEIKMIDTAKPYNPRGLSGFNIESGTCGMRVMKDGMKESTTPLLVVKNISNTHKGSFIPLFNNEFLNKANKILTLQEWYSKENVLYYGDEGKTRQWIIETVADKDGGTHFDKKISVLYSKVRDSKNLNIIIDDEVADWGNNPVYVSIRQIAWEVMESLKNCDI